MATAAVPVRVGALKRGATPADGGYDHIHWITLCVFAVYVVAWFLQIGIRWPALGAIRFELVMALSLVVLAMFTPRQKPAESCSLYKNIALYYLVYTASLMWSYDFDTSWLIFIDRFVKFSFMAFFIVVFVRTPTALIVFLCAFLFACLKLGEEGFIGTVTGSLIWENQGVMRLNGPTPLYAHPNSFSGMALGTLPFILYLFPLVNKYLKGILLVLLGFSLNIILHAGSRTTYVGFLMFLLLLLLRSKQKFKFIAIGAVVTFIALPLIPEQYLERFQSIGGQEKEGHSKEKRKVIIQDALVIFSEHPFGVGVAAFSKVRIARFGRNQDTHNLYLEIATNVGIQGFIIWVFMIVAIYRNNSRLRAVLQGQMDRLRARAPPDLDPASPYAKHLANLRLMHAVMNAVWGYLSIRLCLGFFGHDTYEIYWWVVMGLTIAIHNLAQVAERITQKQLENPELLPPEPDKKRNKRARALNPAARRLPV
jgi:putative inorganic carbon (HCO3(-)) transporter